MFELPNAKRVRRDDILSRNSTSRSPSPAPSADLSDAHRRLGELLNIDQLLAPTPTPQDNPEAKNEDEDEEQEFEFRLFSASTTKPAASKSTSTDGAGKPTRPDAKQKDDGQPGGTQKLRIRLNSPAPGEVGLEDGRFVNPFRGWQYYFTTPELLSGTTAEGAQSAEALLKKKQFEAAAVTGQQMLGWAQVPWPGCSYPWKVRNLKRHETKLPRPSGETSSAVVYIVEPADRVPKSHKKPGKKRRLQLRKRVAAAERAKETEAEKRNRKNRERKLKRRQKARELKAATAAVKGEGQDVAAVKVEEDSASSQDEDD